MLTLLGFFGDFFVYVVFLWLSVEASAKYSYLCTLKNRHFTYSSSFWCKNFRFPATKQSKYFASEVCLLRKMALSLPRLNSWTMFAHKTFNSFVLLKQYFSMSVLFYSANGTNLSASHLIYRSRIQSTNPHWVQCSLSYPSHWNQWEFWIKKAGRIESLITMMQLPYYPQSDSNAEWCICRLQMVGSKMCSLHRISFVWITSICFLACSETRKGQVLK